MTAVETLIALLGGDRTAPVLGACRLESGGADAFGGEAVGDAFRRAPVAGLDAAAIVASPLHLALFADAEAVFADLYGAHIGRLWRVGQTDPGPPEPTVGVAFDPDLRQARAGVFFAAADHPDLAVDAATRVEAAGHALIAAATTFRSRVFVVRAMGDAARGAALFAVHTLAAPPVRLPGLTMAAARWDGETVQLVRDSPAAHLPLVRIAG